MTQNICKCGKGYESQWDLKCGHCRTKKDTDDLAKMQANSPHPPGHIRIVHAHVHQPTPHDVLIGTGSPLANPFGWLGGTAAQHTMKTKEEAQEAYLEYITRMVSKAQPNEVMQTLEEIILASMNGQPVKLVCSNKDCHAEILKKFCDDLVRYHMINQG
jgi:Domain of unknown function (DUF4326)